MISRRGLFRAVSATVAGSAGAALIAWPRGGHDAAPVSSAGLRVHAAKRGLSFGCEVRAGELADPAYTRAILAEADMIVPGVEMKWGATEHHQGKPDYRGADAIADFAGVHRLRLRGHAGMWYRNVPPWAAPMLAAPDGPKLAIARVAAIVGRYRGRVYEWDVVNEAVEPKDGLPGGLRRAPFGRAIGAGWIADCFHAAREADPRARLFYNDYGLEYDTVEEDRRRAAVLGLLGELKRRGAPVTGLGLQSHIGVGRRFDAGKYRAFLAAVAAMGLEMRLTEFDVASRMAPHDIDGRDRAVADTARTFLDVALDERAVKGVLTWGLRDTDTWMYEYRGVPRSGPEAERPLPFAEDWSRKPLWYAIARAFDAAPIR